MSDNYFFISLKNTPIKDNLQHEFSHFLVKKLDFHTSSKDFCIENIILYILEPIVTQRNDHLNEKRRIFLPILKHK